MSSKNRRRSSKSSSASSLRYTQDGTPLSVKRAKQLRTAMYAGIALVSVLLIAWLFYDL